MAMSKSTVQLLLSVKSLTMKLLFFKALQAGATTTSRGRLSGLVLALLVLFPCA
jgi:hypothetical protein